jgi:1-deoxy-D-xylulose-5-phosphate reductoisomerase
MKRVAILGSTGSIGRQALEVISRFPEELELVGVSAFRSVQELRGILERFRPKAVALGDENSKKIFEGCRHSSDLYFGEDGLVSLATRDDVDLVLVALVGIAGLTPTLEALKKGKTVALATKEALVAGGRLIREVLSGIGRGNKSPQIGGYRSEGIGEGREKRFLESGGSIKTGPEDNSGLDLIGRNEVGAETPEVFPGILSGRLIPVDSEHSAIFQCLEGKRGEEIRKIILTASGGPFLNRNPRELERITPEEAIAHPVWRMGPKISVDSATMMNKALEIIEAHFLFGLPPEQIEVLIHPQSIVHGMVEFRDGFLQALLSVPDMRLPIQYALLYPRRMPSLVRTLDLALPKRA